MSLQAGQVIRYGQALWRVDYVNEFRARIVPLTKRHVVIKDDDGDEKRAFDSEQRGVNISPNSCLDVIIDVERAKDEIELRKAEMELAELQAALARPLPAPKPAPAPKAAQKPATLGVRAAKGGGWRVGPTPAPTFRDGSLAEMVMACIVAMPGADTKTLVAAVQAEGNVAACISRFFQAGFIERV